MAQAINGDLSIRAVVDTSRMDWTASPVASVWRKRMHLVGPAESGQVTSIVRYEARSKFPVHEHPDGEEIFVLEGTFSDEHGHWPAGTLLLNPEGFRHAPFSDQGCVLVVRLRQFQGRQRHHVVVDTKTLAWQPTPIPGIVCKLLYEQPGFSDRVLLERWDPGTERGVTRYAQGAELFVLDGELADEAGTYRTGCWLRFPVGSRHRPRSTEGCTLYVKRSGLAYLTSAV